jgi:hypothetical protein
MIKCCTFCSKDAEVLFTHPIHHIGSLCLGCYMHFHGSCGGCNVSLMPTEIMEDVTYRIQAKFINIGEKSFVFCDDCYEEIRLEFSNQFV